MLRQTVLTLLLLAGITGWVASAGAKKSTHAQEISYDQQIKPLLAKYCYGCHGGTKKKADLSLQAFRSEADAIQDRALWERVLKNIETRAMPPENKPQPALAERDLIIRWIQTKVFQCDCTQPDPGRVTLRRLNRAEYNHTIRDLVGVDFRPADDFPEDDTGYGFDNIGDVLSLSPVLFEKYLMAAEKILDQAIVSSPHTNGPSVKILASQMEATGVSEPAPNGAVKLMREGHLKTTFRFPKAGRYLIRIWAWGDQAGEEPPKMRLRVDEKNLATFEVKNTARDGVSFAHRLEVASPGPKEIAVAYINNFRDPDHPDKEKRDRNLAVEFIRINGPSGPPEFPETHRRIFSQLSPPPVRQGEGVAVSRSPAPSPWPEYIRTPEKEAEAARPIIAAFARRAFRRPVTASETDRLMRIYDLARGDGESLEGGVRLALEAILVSPHFLFRGEWQPEPDNPRQMVPVDDFALATRLSYFLWSTMPDEELSALAEKKTLRKNVNASVRRMLRDPKAGAFVQNFVGQWLQLRNLETVQPDATEFPDFNEDLRAAMQKETELLFAHVLREERSILEIINADYSFLNERLARHYGMKNVPGNSFRKVKLASGARGGVLTHASILTLTSNPTRTSPVKRGKWVLENILGTPPPPPPPDVPDLKEEKHAQLTGTLRQRMEQHRADPSCAGCHARMDPIGFGLENFDGIGAWRKQEGGFAIDSSGTLVSGENFQGAAELKKILAEKKKEDFARCLTKKMLTYALGRGLEYYDQCAVDKICQDLARHNYRFSRLVLGIANSVPFQMRRGEGGR